MATKLFLLPALALLLLTNGRLQYGWPAGMKSAEGRSAGNCSNTAAMAGARAAFLAKVHLSYLFVHYPCTTQC
jgi:hypothetical protein